MNFPAAVIVDGAITRLVTAPESFTGPDGVQHPAAAWDAWNSVDWAALCPGWTVLPVIDNRPNPNPAKVIERLPESEWEITVDAVAVAYRITNKSPDELAADLRAMQSDAVDRVNREAGEARSRFITVTVGQEGTYLDKSVEAEAFLTDPAPSAEKYPYLYAEAEATGQTVEDVAALVDLTAKAWRPTNARIEGLRQGSLKRIREAANPADVAAVFPIPWPQPS